MLLLMTRLTPPPEVRAIVAQVRRAAALTCAPRFEWVESAHGYGGLFSPGLVVVGARDIQEIVAAIVRRRFRPVPPHLVDWLRWQGQPLVLLSELTQALTTAATRSVVSHEFGHAMEQDAGRVGGGVFAERRADYQAGVLSEQIGWPEGAEPWVFDEIGCREPEEVCMHAAPETRVADFRAGRVDVAAERARLQEQQRMQRLLAGVLFWQHMRPSFAL